MSKFVLTRVWVGAKGCFGTLAYNDEPPFAVTLERYFEEKAEEDHTVIKPGTSLCKLSHYNKGGYPTYEVQFPDGSHSRVLFHKGNQELHSAGCILVGEYFHDFDGGPGIANSGGGFNEFMGKTKSVPEFWLEVIEVGKP